MPCAQGIRAPAMVVDRLAARAAQEHAGMPEVRFGSLDTMSPAARSERMARIKGRDTKPEMRVRKLVHALGFRFRLASSHLPGRPDIVLPRHHKIILVHGCFWHQHHCSRGRIPKSPERQKFWRTKLARNKERDREVLGELRTKGWRVLVVWECEVYNLDALKHKVHRFLCSTSPAV